MTGEDKTTKIDLIVTQVVDDVHVRPVLVRTLVVLRFLVLADFIALQFKALVEDLSADMLEAPAFHGQVGDGVSGVGHSRFEVVLAEYLIEPGDEGRCPYSGQSKSIQFCHFRAISQQMGSSVDGKSGSETVSCDSESKPICT